MTPTTPSAHIRPEGRLQHPAFTPQPEVLGEGYKHAHALYQSPDTQARLLTAIFPAQELAPAHSSFHFGFARRNDERIVRAVINLITQLRGERPVRILELGAGRSYGDTEHCGAPWLARTLKQAFQERVDITISDREDRDIQMFYCSQQGELRTLCIHRFPAREIPFSPLRPRNGAPPESDWTTWKDIQQKHPQFADALLRNTGPAFRDAPGSGPGRLSFRPALDPEFEQHVFGIKVITPLTWSEVEKGIPAGSSFDLVFLRHLPYAMKVFSQSIIRSADTVTQPSGLVLIHGDWEERWKQPESIFSDSGDED